MSEVICHSPFCPNKVKITGDGSAISGHDAEGNRVFFCSLEHLRKHEETTTIDRPGSLVEILAEESFCKE